MKPTRIFETQDGSHSIHSEKYGVSYHSKYGAIQESQHVFIEAGLYEVALSKKNIRILEIGMGTGLNAFMTYLESNKRNFIVHYETVEAFPITAEEAQQLNYPQLLNAEEGEGIFEKIHQEEWGKEIPLTPQFTFKKVLDSFENLSYKKQFDLIYFDAFAPTAQPELWDEKVLKIMFEALVPGGVWVSYCAKGAVKRQLKALGFRIEAIPGPPGKREMTRAIK
jgi:tRNA U34 5-methylaminomethyl-2-thiouridine-forming methyltransferase MnmC